MGAQCFIGWVVAATRCAVDPPYGARLPVAARRLLGLLLGLLLCLPAAADFLEPEKAFRFRASLSDAKTVTVTYDIADGYYMYRERFAFRAEGASLGAARVPAGAVKFDATFQKDVETHRGRVTIAIPVEAEGPFILIATSQGCSDKGLCYSPMESVQRLSPGAGSGLLGAVAALRGDIGPPQADAPGAGGASMPSASGDAEMGRIQAALSSGKLIAVVPLFLLLGLGLAFTPCVLPMMPILSSIIVGEGTSVSRRHGFALAAVYSLGMALVYTGLGIAAGLAGEGLAASLQHPWVLTAFALLMVALALSMFDVYSLQVPAGVQAALSRMSGRQRSGRFAGVFAMGSLSALIVGPCVAAPLAGALLFISQTRDVAIGGSALFAMAAGMSVPLLLLGASAGSLLPKAGPWMQAVKRAFGVMMLAVGLWMVTPVIPAWAQMAGWAALGIGVGSWLLRGSSARRTAAAWSVRLVGLLVFIAGGAQLVGALTGGRDPLAPLAHLSGNAAHGVTFERVRSNAELDAALARAAASGRPVMLDFYADWCVSCKEMERFTFTDPQVRAHLDRMVLLQADVTANNADDKALLKRFQLFGPPGIIFFGAHGAEVAAARVIGFQRPARFLESLVRAGENS